MTMRNKQTLAKKKAKRHRSVPVCPANLHPGDTMDHRSNFCIIAICLYCFYTLLYRSFNSPSPSPSPSSPSPSLSPDTIHRPCLSSLPPFLSLPNTYTTKRSHFYRSHFLVLFFALLLPPSSSCARFSNPLLPSARLFLLVLCSLSTCRIHSYKLCASC